jgi:hypothetical protein
MSEFGTNDASHELIPLYMYALTLPTKQTKKNALPGFLGPAPQKAYVLSQATNIVQTL